MTELNNHKYHSTGQFRNVIKNIKSQANYHEKPAPTLIYIGTVKLHGTNGSIILHEDGVISFHSKNNLLGSVTPKGEFTLGNDNANFAQSMYQRINDVREVVEQAKNVAKSFNGTELYPLKISGEWCGSGVQKGVGISYLPKRSFFIFGIKAGETLQLEKQGWLPVLSTQGITTQDNNDAGIYSILDFPYKVIEIDFTTPEFIQNTLVKYTEECEEVCPVSEQLHLKDGEGEPQTLGEGYVWTPIASEYCWDSGNWFKTKGKKHSVSKSKSVAAICPERLKGIQEFVEYSITLNRLEQGLGEVGLDQKNIGKFIGWVGKDVSKEEGDTLEANNLTMKDVGKYIASKSREFYMNKLNRL